MASAKHVAGRWLHRSQTRNLAARTSAGGADAYSAAEPPSEWWEGKVLPWAELKMKGFFAAGSGGNLHEASITVFAEKRKVDACIRASFRVTASVNVHNVQGGIIILQVRCRRNEFLEV